MCKYCNINHGGSDGAFFYRSGVNAPLASWEMKGYFGGSLSSLSHLSLNHFVIIYSLRML